VLKKMASSGGHWGCAVELRFLGVSAAPSLGWYLFAIEQRAAAYGVAGFTLVQSAAAAVLTGGEFREFGFVYASGVGLVTQACGGGVFFVNKRERCKS